MSKTQKSKKCPRCASYDVMFLDAFEDGADLYLCMECEHEFEVGSGRTKLRESDYSDCSDYSDYEDFEGFGHERAGENWRD